MKDELTDIDDIIKQIKSIKVKDIYNKYKKNDNLILGQDQFFVSDKENEHMEYIVTKQRSITNIPDLYKYITSKFTNYINESTCNLRLKLIDENTFGYSTESTETIMKYTFKEIDSIDSYDIYTLINEAKVNSNKIKIFIAENGYIVAASHLFFDGIAITNFKNLVEDFPDKLELPYYKYVPYINEMRVLSSMNNLLELYEYGRTFSLDYSKKMVPKEMIPYDNSIKIIKNLKDTYNSMHKKKVSFPLVFYSIQMLSLFNSSNKKSLIASLAIAFENKTRFNNFSAITIKVERPEFTQLNKDNCKKILLDFIKVINKEIIKKKDMVATVYSITNIYNLNVKVNNHIDVLISCIPVNRKKPYSIKNVVFDSMYTFMPYSSAPIYIISLGNYLKTNNVMNVKTNDVDIAKIKHFNDNIDKWLS